MKKTLSKCVTSLCQQNSAIVFLIGSLCLPSSRAFANIYITANNAADSDGPIETRDFSNGQLVGSFIPTGAANQNGRAIAIQGSEIFYTEVSHADFSSDGIHVAPYGSLGSGGEDVRVLPNPQPGVGIAGLAFWNGSLYVLTGYGSSSSPQVYKLDPSTGAVLAGPITISGPYGPTPAADGFAVLPNGNFLINDDDGEYAVTTYREYSSSTGAYVPNGLFIDLSTLNCPVGSIWTGYGVTLSPDASSLYFAADVLPYPKEAIVQTDLSGNLITAIAINDIEIEAIAAVSTDISTPPVIINVQFGSTGAGTQKVGIAATGNSSSDVWNWFRIGLEKDNGDMLEMDNLVDSAGNPTTVAVAEGDGGGVYASVPGATDPLLDSWVQEGAGSQTLEIDNLPAGTYDLYFYGIGGDMNPPINSTFQLASGVNNLGSFSALTTSPSLNSVNTYVAGDQYVVFHGVQTTGPSTPIVINCWSDTAAVCNGIQIVKH